MVDKGLEILGTGIGSLQNLLVGSNLLLDGSLLNRSIGVAAGLSVDDDAVGDQGKTNNLDAAVASDNNLGDGRHTDNIGTDLLQEAALGLGLVRGARDKDVDTLVQELGDVQLLGSLVHKAAEAGAVGIRHGREAGAKLSHVGSNQGVVAGHTGQVDVVLNDADIADLEGRVQTTGSVGDYCRRKQERKGGQQQDSQTCVRL